MDRFNTLFSLLGMIFALAAAVFAMLIFSKLGDLRVALSDRPLATPAPILQSAAPSPSPTQSLTPAFRKPVTASPSAQE